MSATVITLARPSTTITVAGQTTTIYLGGVLAGGGGTSGMLSALAGAPVGGHRAVVQQANQSLVHYDPGQSTHHDAIAGISTNAAGAGQSVAVRALGIIEFGSWAWTAGLPVFATTDGLLTQSPPASVAVQVGLAVSATALFVRPELPIFTL